MSDDSRLGPVEIVLIGFPDFEPTGQIAAAIADVVDAGIVTILDLLFVSKDADETVTVVELTELDDELAAPFLELDGSAGGLLSEDDLDHLGDALEPGTAALAVVWENSWARALSSAILGAGGVLIAHDRIDAATVNVALDALADLD